MRILLIIFLLTLVLNSCAKREELQVINYDLIETDAYTTTHSAVGPAKTEIPDPNICDSFSIDCLVERTANDVYQSTVDAAVEAVVDTAIEKATGFKLKEESTQKAKRKELPPNNILVQQREKERKYNQAINEQLSAINPDTKEENFIAPPIVDLKSNQTIKADEN